MENVDGSKRRNWEKIVALNVKTEDVDGSEHRDWEETMALNAKRKANDDSECQNETMQWL